MKTSYLLIIAILIAAALTGCKDNVTEVKNNTDEILSSKTFTNISVVVANVSIEYNFSSSSHNTYTNESTNNSYKQFENNQLNFGMIEPYDTFINIDSSYAMGYSRYTRTDYYSGNSYYGNAKILLDKTKQTFENIEINNGYSSTRQDNKPSPIYSDSYNFYVILKNVPFEIVGDSLLYFSATGKGIQQYINKISHSTNSSTSNSPVTSNSSKSPTGNLIFSDSSSLYVRMW